jgi:hypothetical protein
MDGIGKWTVITATVPQRATFWVGLAFEGIGQ